VNHDILLRKMIEEFDLSPHVVRLLRSYLSNRCSESNLGPTYHRTTLTPAEFLKVLRSEIYYSQCL